MCHWSYFEEHSVAEASAESGGTVEVTVCGEYDAKSSSPSVPSNTWSSVPPLPLVETLNTEP